MITALVIKIEASKMPGDNTAHEQLADIFLGYDTVDNHGHTGRDENSQRTGCGHKSHGVALGVAPSIMAGQHDSADGGGCGRAGAGNGRKNRTGHNGHNGQAAGQVPEPGPQGQSGTWQCRPGTWPHLQRQRQEWLEGGGDSREANILWTIIKRLKSLVVARIIMAAIAREMAMGTFKRNRAMKILKKQYCLHRYVHLLLFHFFHPIATAVLQNLIEVSPINLMANIKPLTGKNTFTIQRGETGQVSGALIRVQIEFNQLIAEVSIKKQKASPQGVGEDTDRPPIDPQGGQYIVKHIHPDVVIVPAGPRQIPGEAPQMIK